MMIEERRESSTDRYWGWCGAPDTGVMLQCFTCGLDLVHPWHDSGEPNTRDMRLWEEGGPPAGPTHDGCRLALYLTANT